MVAEKLESGLTVLFIGLGCDVAALKSFLRSRKTDTSKLFTMDLICFGPTLQEVHEQYISRLERKHKSHIKNFTVRFKKQGWVPSYVMAEFEDGRRFYEQFYESDYGRAFSRYARRVCYGCKFRGDNHQSDITVGDYWGLTPEMQGYNHNGVSVLLVHTERGQELVDMIDAREFTIQPADAEFVVEHNTMYYRCREKPKDYEKFCADLRSSGLHRAIVKHYGGPVKYAAVCAKRFVKRLIPLPVKKVLKRLMGK